MRQMPRTNVTKCASQLYGGRLDAPPRP
jgi:hypothetical protein